MTLANILRKYGNLAENESLFDNESGLPTERAWEAERAVVDLIDSGDLSVRDDGIRNLDEFDELWDDMYQDHFFNTARELLKSKGYAEDAFEFFKDYIEGYMCGYELSFGNTTLSVGDLYDSWRTSTSYHTCLEEMSNFNEKETI